MELVPALVSKPAHYTWQKKEHGIYRTVTEVYLPNFRFLALCSVANAVAVFPKKKPDCQRPTIGFPALRLIFRIQSPFNVTGMLAGKPTQTSR